MTSPCFSHIATILKTNLVIKDAQTLRTTHIFPLGPDDETEIQVTMVKWEPLFEARVQKIGVVLASLGVLKIYDLGEGPDSQDKAPITILEVTFGIESFDWVPPCTGPEYRETAYRGAKQVMVFSRVNLQCTLYSLDAPAPLTTLFKPKFNRIFPRPESNLWCVVLRDGAKDHLLHFANHDTHSTQLFGRELHNVLDTQSLSWSFSGRWLMVNHQALAGIKVSIFNTLGVFAEDNTPVMQLVDSEDRLSLGASMVKWAAGDSLLVGTMEGDLVVYLMETLKVTRVLKHPPEKPQGTSWREQLEETGEPLFTAVRNEGLYPKRKHVGVSTRRANYSPTGPSNGLAGSLPQGFRYVAHAHGHTAVVLHRLPNTVFIYDEEYALHKTIVGLEPVIALEWHPSKVVLQFASSLHVSLVQGSLVRAVPPLKNLKRIRRCRFMEHPSSLRLLVVDADSYATISCTEGGSQPPVALSSAPASPTLVSPERQGSPAPFPTDDPTARDLASGVQHHEWATSRDLAVEDTFKLKHHRPT